MDEKKVSIIIPAYNEEKTIADIISRIQSLHPFVEIIVINDGSTDNTAASALSTGAKVYNHPYNIGNGAAVKSGIRAATGDILIFMDGDGQHDPADIQKLLDHFPEYDMVVGSRSQNGQASFGRALGNTVYNWFASYVTKFSIKDLTSGFRAVKSDIARNFVFLLPNTYSYPTTITLGVLRSGNSVKYIPIRVQKRQNGHSSIKIFQDGIKFFMIITRIATLYSPMRVFLPVSFILFLLGLFRYAYTLTTEARFTNMSALFFVSAVIIFMMSLISEQICQMRYERRSAPRASRYRDSVKAQQNHEVRN